MGPSAVWYKELVHQHYPRIAIQIALVLGCRLNNAQQMDRFRGPLSRWTYLGALSADG